MLWPSIKKRTAKKTANSNFPIPNEGSGPAGGVVFESVVIRATSFPNRFAAVDPPFYDALFPRRRSTSPGPFFCYLSRRARPLPAESTSLSWRTCTSSRGHPPCGAAPDQPTSGREADRPYRNVGRLGGTKSRRFRPPRGFDEPQPLLGCRLNPSRTPAAETIRS
jgi:hypothetical protein